MALTSLETNFAEALKDVKLPVLTKPARLAVSDETLRAIVDLGLPVSELNKIMQKAAAIKGGSEIITDLMRVLQLEKNVSLKNFDTLIKGLAEGTRPSSGPPATCWMKRNGLPTPPAALSTAA